MRNIDIIEDIATREARGLVRLDLDLDLDSPEEERTKKSPRVAFEKNDMGRLEAHGVGHAGHENANRMDIVCDFLNRSVLPYTEAESRGLLRGTSYAIELHDSYRWPPLSGVTTEDEVPRDVADRYAGKLVFSRGKRDRGPVLFPDVSQMLNHFGTLRVADPSSSYSYRPWSQKKKTMFFAGSTTGRREPERNARINACVWSLDHRDISEFYITHITQMERAHALARVPRLADCYKPPVLNKEGRPSFAYDAHHHFLHRIGVNLPGNTCSWTRVPSVLNSRSVLFDDAFQRDTVWYTPLLQDGVHYVATDMGVHRNERGEMLWSNSSSTPVKDARNDLEHHDLVRKYLRFVDDEARCSAMADAANTIVKEFLLAPHAASYAKTLFETSAFLSAP